MSPRPDSNVTLQLTHIFYRAFYGCVWVVLGEWSAAGFVWGSCFDGDRRELVWRRD